MHDERSQPSEISRGERAQDRIFDAVHYRLPAAASQQQPRAALAP